MQRNQKYHSNYFSQPNLVKAGYFPPQAFGRIDSRMILQQQLPIDLPVIKKQEKQNSMIMRNSSPYQNQYSFFSNNFNKQDQFTQMQTYLSSIYSQRKQKRRQQQYSFQQNQQKFRQQNLVLPAILIKRNQCIKDRQAEQIRRIKQLQQRFSKLAMMGYNNRMQQNGCFVHGQQQQQFNSGCQQCGRGVIRNPIQQQPQPIKKSLQKQKKHQQRKSQQIPQKPRVSAQRRKRLLSKFRSIGYAVFFAVIFPHYSYLFGHFKLKQFLQKYLVQQNSYIRKMNFRIEQKFKQIPLYQEIRQIHQQYQQANDFQNRKNQQDPKIKILNQITNQNYIINLNVFKKVLSMMISTFTQFVDRLNQQQIQFLSVGMLNTSYYGDEIYSVQEMPFINCHQQKGNIRVSKKQQKALLLSNFVIKRIIYQNLVRLAIDPQWHEEMATYSALKKHQRDFFKIICKQIQLCALLMYEMAIKNFYLLIDSEKKGNFLDLSDSALPLPLKTMRFPTLFMTGSQRQIFTNGFGYYNIGGVMQQQEQKPQIIQGPYKLKDEKKKGNNDKNFNKNNINNNNNNKKGKNSSQRVYQGSVEKFESQYDFSSNQKQIFQQYLQLIQQDPLNIIHNSTQFTQLSHIITQYLKSSYQKMQKSMMKIVQKLHMKVNQKKRKNYKRYKQKVMRKKFILTKQHEILQGVVFLRNEQQKKLVAMSRKMLEIYQQTLQDHQYEMRDLIVSDLNSKRELMKNNSLNKNKNKKNKIGSMVSIMTLQSDRNSTFYGKSSQLSYRRKK